MSVSSSEYLHAPYVNGAAPPTADDAVAKPTPVEADTVNVSGAVSEVRARVVNVERGGISMLRAEDLTTTLKNSGIGAAAVGSLNATLENSGIGALAARKAEVKGGAISVLAAANVELKDGAKVYFDLRAGALAGLIMGVVIATLTGFARVAGRIRPARKAAI
jgi:hypothetical protein